jgi:hypothetical protein
MAGNVRLSHAPATGAICSPKNPVFPYLISGFPYLLPDIDYVFMKAPLLRRTVMKKIALIMAMAALVCWAPGQALADFVPCTTFDSILDTVTSHHADFDASLGNYGNVHVGLNEDGTVAQVTITALKDPDFDFKIGLNIFKGYSAFLNVNAGIDSFNEDAKGFWVSDKGSFTPDGLGTFNLAASNQLFGTVESVTITLTRTSGTWAHANEVLVANDGGFDAGAWLVEDNGRFCKPWGYVGEAALTPPSGAVPLPPTVLFLGSGLLGLAGLGRFRKG